MVVSDGFARNSIVGFFQAWLKRPMARGGDANSQFPESRFVGPAS
jgi:hypothetical protein